MRHIDRSSWRSRGAAGQHHHKHVNCGAMRVRELFGLRVQHSFKLSEMRLWVVFDECDVLSTLSCGIAANALDRVDIDCEL